MSIGAQTQGDANSLKGKPFEPISPGNYVITLDRVMDREGKNVKPGMSGPAKYLDLSFKVAEGEHKGRLIFGTRFFYDNVSPKAVEISNEKANKLLNAMGVNGGLDALGSDLHAIEDYVGKEVVAKVDVEYPQGFKARNIIKSFQRR
jgi:hypothetical protein